MAPIALPQYPCTPSPVTDIAVQFHGTIPKEQAKPLLPTDQSSLTVQITIQHEKEAELMKPKPAVTETATQLLDVTQNSINVSQIDVGQFEGEFIPEKPTTSKVNQSYENEKRSVMVEQPESNIAFAPVEQVSTTKAQIEITPAIGTNVSETKPTEIEAELKPDRRPSLSKADISSYGSKKSIQVSQVVASDTEEVLKEEEKQHAKIQLTPATPITIEETITEDKPDKYYPEHFVPTESATKSFITQNAITSSDNIVNESEGIYDAGAKRTAVKATPEFNIETCIEVQSHGIHDSLGTELLAFESPIVNAAEGGAENLESFSTEQKQIFEKESEFIKPKLETTSAQIDILPKTELTSTITIANEQEKPYEAEIKPEAKARVEQLELKPGIVTETIAHESEGIYTAAELDIKQAGFSLQTTEVPSKREAIPLETSASTEFQLAMDKKIADESYNLLQVSENTQVQAEEKEIETDLKLLLTTTNATPEINTLESLNVSLAQSTESEHILTTEELPEKHTTTAETVLRSSWPTANVEEILQGDLATELETPKEAEHIGKIIPNTTNAILEIETLQPYETVRRKETPATATENATKEQQETLPTVESCTTLIQDKEKDFQQDKPDLMTASQGLTSASIVATSIEIQANTAVGELLEEMPALSTAKPSATICKSLQIEENIVNSMETPFDAETKPDEKQADINLQLIENLATNSIVKSVSKEDVFITEAQPAMSQVTVDIDSKLIVATKGQEIPSIGLGPLETPTPTTAAGQLKQDEVESVVVTENVTSQNETEFIPGEFDKKTATGEFQLEESFLESSTHFIEEKESSTAEFVLPELKSITESLTTAIPTAISSQIETNEAIGDKIELEKEQASANIGITPSHELQVTQSLPNENETIFETKETESFQPKIDLIEHKPQINIEEIVSADLESKYDTIKSQEFNASLNFQKQYVPQSEIVLTSETPNELFVEKATEELSKIELNPITLATTTLQEIIDTEGKLEEDVKPKERKAISELSSVLESITVDQVQTTENENKLEEFESIQNTAFVGDLIEQLPLGQELVQTSDTVGEITQEIPTTDTAKKDLVPHKSKVAETVVPFEAIGAYDELLKPEEKEAGVNYAGAEISVEITQVLAAQGTTEFVEETRETVQAQGSISPVHVPMTEETQPTHTVGTTEQLTLDTTSIQPSSIGHKSKTVSMTIVNESEGEFKPLELPESKQPLQSFDTSEETTITETTVDESHTHLEIEAPESKLASPSYVPMKAASQQETVPAQSEVGFERTPELGNQVQQIFEEGQALRVQSVITDERSTELEQPIINEKKPGVSYSPHEPVQVDETQVQDSEDQFLPSDHDMKTASYGFEPLTTITQSEVNKQENVAELEIKAPETTKAKPTQTSFDNLNVSQVSASENVKELTMPEKPTESTASASIVEHRTLEEVTMLTGDLVSDLEEMIQPTEKHAHIEIEQRPIPIVNIQDEVIEAEEMQPKPEPFMHIAKQAYQVETLDEEEEVEAGDHIGMRAKKTQYIQDDDGSIRERKITETRFRRDDIDTRVTIEEEVEEKAVEIEEIIEEEEEETKKKMRKAKSGLIADGKINTLKEFSLCFLGIYFC